MSPRDPAAQFVIDLIAAKKATDEWSEEVQANPRGPARFGSSAFWEAAEQLTTYRHLIQSGLRLFPPNMKMALANLAKNLQHYDNVTQSAGQKIEVPLTLVNDLTYMFEALETLDQLHTEPFQIQSPKAMLRAGENSYDIARSWGCKLKNGDLDIDTVEAELDEPGSQEHFKRHPQQIERDRQRTEWLEFWEPIKEQVEEARNGGEIAGQESIEYLCDMGVPAEEAAARIGVPVQIVQLAYNGLDAQQNPTAKKARPASNRKPKSTKTAKKGAKNEEPTGPEAELRKLTDAKLIEFAESFGVAVAEPLDRELLIGQVLAAQEAPLSG